MSTIFSVSKVSFSYPGGAAGSARERVLKDVSLEIRRGERLGIVGESGSGKTTLLNLLLRLTFPTSGTASFEGQDMRRMRRSQVRAFRRLVQPVFQDPFLSLDPTQKVEGIVGEPLASLGLCANRDERRRLSAAALARVGLNEETLDRRPAAFSGGQRQRIAIARALVTNPAVLIADEPVSALDVITKTEILRLLADISAHEPEFTLVMVSHDLPIVALAATRAAVLRRGEIVEDAPVADILRAPRHEYTKLLLQSAL